MTDIRVVPRPRRGNRNKMGLFLMYKQEVLAGPFDTRKEAIAAKFEWVRPRLKV